MRPWILQGGRRPWGHIKGRPDRAEPPGRKARAGAGFVLVALFSVLTLFQQQGALRCLEPAQPRAWEHRAERSSLFQGEMLVSGC